MPAVTVPPNPNGLPIASTQSPTRSLSERPNSAAFKRRRRIHLEKREVGLVVDADDLGSSFSAVGEVGDDLVGVGDHVVVGDDQAGRIDDEAGAERLHRLRAVAPLLLSKKLSKKSSPGAAFGGLSWPSGVPWSLGASWLFGASGVGVRREMATRCEVEI